jgi:adenine phosphoribosyltransferase
VIAARRASSGPFRRELILFQPFARSTISSVRKMVTPSDIAERVRNIPDFPKPGIQFKDITPVLADPRLFAGAIDLLIANHVPGSIDAVVGIDARGFIFASAAALKLQSGFVPIRKKGKLPFETHEASYDLEYGSNTVAIHTDAVQKGSRVLLVDDLLATGGTAGAAIALLQKIGAEIVEASFLIELNFLNGRQKLDGVKVTSLVQY